MPADPAWIFRLASFGSTFEWSYATSSGPKHRSHTYVASSAYSVPHSLHRSPSSAIFLLLRPVAVYEKDLCVVRAEVRNRTSTHISQALRLLELAPISGLATFGGCRGFFGPVPPPLWMQWLCGAGGYQGFARPRCEQPVA